MNQKLQNFILLIQPISIQLTFCLLSILIFFMLVLNRLNPILTKNEQLQKNNSMISALSTRQKILTQTSKSSLQNLASKLDQLLPTSLDLISLHNAIFALSKNTGINILTTSNPVIDKKLLQATLSISFNTQDEISIFLDRVQTASGRFIILESLSFDQDTNQYEAQLTFPFFDQKFISNSNQNLIDQAYLEKILKSQ